MPHAQRNPRHALKLTRIIPASRKEVFEAWTTAESVKQWMCPEGSTVSFAELDVRVGGVFRIDMLVNGANIGHTGTYREIVPPERLVFTWLSKYTHFRESLVTLEFLARGEATELILLQTQLPDEEAVQRHTAGWTQLLEHLMASLQKKITGSRENRT